MLRIWSALPLLAAIAGCAPQTGQDGLVFPDPDSKADDAGRTPPTMPSCASPKLEAIFHAAEKLVPRGSVPGELFASEHNRADQAVLIDGPQIFPAFRKLIATAQYNVSLQTYVWEPSTDPTNEILAGLAELNARRLREQSSEPPVEVRFIFDVSTVGFGSNGSALPQAWASIEALHLDPRHVRVELAGFYHLAFGNLHVKTLVVDGTQAIITGANPQAHHNYADPWRDAGFQVAGDVALALLADFDGAWRKSKVWLCGSESGGSGCKGKPQQITWHIADSEPDLAEACLPMLVTTRAADASPLSNRTDNTQDQAFVAAFDAATDHIYVQTPNLNDDAAREALVRAVKRGVRVDVVLSKGFNDQSENLPGQGGTNIENIDRLYEALADEGISDPCDRLRFRWYSRNGVPVEGNGLYASHAKYTSIDSEIAIVGTANMDTQSWNNSREVNIVVDDPATTRAWDAQLFEKHFDRGTIVEQCQ